MERSTPLEITRLGLAGSCSTTSPPDQVQKAAIRREAHISWPWEAQSGAPLTKVTPQFFLTPAAMWGRLRTRQLSGNPEKGSATQNSQKREEGTCRGSAFHSVPCLWVCRTHGEHSLRTFKLALTLFKDAFSL